MHRGWLSLLVLVAILSGCGGGGSGATQALPHGSQSCTQHDVFDADAPNYPVAPGMNLYASFTAASSMPILIVFTEAAINEDFTCVSAPLTSHSGSQWTYRTTYSTSPVTTSDGTCTYSDQTTGGNVRVIVDTSAGTAYVSVNGVDTDTPVSGTNCPPINNGFAFNDTVPYPSY